MRGFPVVGAPELKDKLTHNFEMEHRFLWHQLTLGTQTETDLPRKVFFEFYSRFGQALQRKFPGVDGRPAGVPTDDQLLQVLNRPFGEMGKGVAIKMFRDVTDEEEKGDWVRGSLFRVMAEPEGVGKYHAEDGMRPYLTIPEVEKLLHPAPLEVEVERRNPGLRLLRYVFHTAFKASAEGGFLSAPSAEVLQRKYEEDVDSHGDLLQHGEHREHRALVEAILDFEFLLDFNRVWMESEKSVFRMAGERFLPSAWVNPDIPYIDTIFTQRRKDKKISKPKDMTTVEIPEDPFQPVGTAAPRTVLEEQRFDLARSFREQDDPDEEDRILSFGGGGDFLLDADAPRSTDPKLVTRPRVNWRMDTIPGELLSRGIPMLHHWSGTLPTILGVVFQEVATSFSESDLVSSAQALRDMRILAMFFMLSFAPWHSLAENLVGLTFFEQTVFPRVWARAFENRKRRTRLIHRSPVDEPEPAPSVTHAEIRPEWILNWARRVFAEVGIRVYKRLLKVKKDVAYSGGRSGVG